MNFGANKTPAEVIKEDAFGGTPFTDIYSALKGKRYNIGHGKNSIGWKILIRSIIVSIIIISVSINMVSNVKHC